jgi:hypothetical protein
VESKGSIFWITSKAALTKSLTVKRNYEEFKALHFYLLSKNETRFILCAFPASPTYPELQTYLEYIARNHSCRDFVNWLTLDSFVLPAHNHTGVTAKFTASLQAYLPGQKKSPAQIQVNLLLIRAKHFAQLISDCLELEKV